MPSWRADLAPAWWRDAARRGTFAGSVVVGVYLLDSGSAPSHGGWGGAGADAVGGFSSDAATVSAARGYLCGGCTGCIERPQAAGRQPRHGGTVSAPHVGHARRRVSCFGRWPAPWASKLQWGWWIVDSGADWTIAGSFIYAYSTVVQSRPPI